MNAYFGYEVVEKLKFISFDDEEKVSPKIEINQKNVTINKYKDKISDVKNEKNYNNFSISFLQCFKHSS